MKVLGVWMGRMLFTYDVIPSRIQRLNPNSTHKNINMELPRSMSDLPPGAKEKFKVLGVRVDQVGGPVGWWRLFFFFWGG